MKKYFNEKIDEPIAVLCARYWYRGTVKEANDDYVVIADAFAVEKTGSATANKSEKEDAIPSDIAISYGAVELVCQPTWAFHGVKGKNK